MFFSLAVQSAARPVFRVPNPEYNFGEIEEGSAKLIQASFTVHNEGADTLIIRDVRPDCGCTVVGYDTVIPPRGKGIITPKVNIEHFPQGVLKKHISVTTNDSVRATVELTITGSIRPIIGFDPQYINLSRGNDSTVNIVLRTQKPDLTVSRVYFQAENDPSNTWRSSLPLHLLFSIKGPTGPDKKNWYQWTVFITPNITDTEYRYGSVIIETNHSRKKKVEIGATINGG